MTPADIIALRLRAQRLVDPPLADPVAVVRRLGAVQSQEFQFAKWTLAQRTVGATDAAIDDLFNTGQIVRTHIMRPTWHFVAPEDLRWLLDLTGQRVQQVNGTVYRQKGLNAAAHARGDDVIRQALQGNRHLTRLELGDHLSAAGLWTGDNVQLAYLVMHAELEGIVCNGPLRGKRHTYALVDEWIPPVAPVDRDDAFDRLLTRFIASHGPVPIRDFTRWSGLTLTESRAGLDRIRDRFGAIAVDGEPYWFDPDLAETPSAPTSGITRLIQMYDEWIMVYASLARLFPAATLPGGMESPSVYAWEQAVTVGGRIVGCWSRTVKRKSVAVTVTIYPEFASVDRNAIAGEAERYGAYHERALDLTIAVGPAKPA